MLQEGLRPRYVSSLIRSPKHRCRYRGGWSRGYRRRRCCFSNPLLSSPCYRDRRLCEGTVRCIRYAEQDVEIYTLFTSRTSNITLHKRTSKNIRTKSIEYQTLSGTKQTGRKLRNRVNLWAETSTTLLHGAATDALSRITAVTPSQEQTSNTYMYNRTSSAVYKH